MRRAFTNAAAVAMAAVLAAAGCSGGDDGGDDEQLPDGGELMAASADEMAEVETVRLRLEGGAEVADLPVHDADAVVTGSGDAEGVATVDLTGIGPVEVQFVLVEDALHYQAVGPWLQMPRSQAGEVYDPSAILDPDRGVSNLLRNASDPEVKGREAVGDVDAYCVTATFPAAQVAEVLPGVTEDVPGTVWIGVDRPLLHRAEFEVSGGTVTATLSEFDEPVDISAP